MQYGRAMGNDEPVTPIFPNSDYWYALFFLSGEINHDKANSFMIALEWQVYVPRLMPSFGAEEMAALTKLMYV